MVNVPLLDLNRVHAPILESMQKAAAEVVADGRYILGPNVRAFEEEMASTIGIQHAVGVSNGTDALRLALIAMHRIHGGGKVITSPFTFIATAEAIVAAGFDVVFADVDPDTALIDPKCIERLIDKETVGVLPVHLFGQCADMNAINALATHHGLWVVEDVAQATGARYGQKMAGSLSSAGCFSFFPSKNLGGVGDGGLITTDDDRVADICMAGRRHGASKEKYRHDFIAGNFRLDEIQAALLRVKAPLLEEWNEQRRQVAKRYADLFQAHGLVRSDGVQPLARLEGSTHVFHQYVVRVPHRDVILAGLRDAGVGCAVYYPIPLHLQKAFEGGNATDCPNSESLAEAVIALPVFPGLTEKEQEYVVSCIAGLLADTESH